MTKDIDINISYLRIFATISIIWLHVCGTLVENLDLFALTNYQVFQYNTFYQLFSFTVPCFFMITGYLLLNKNITYKKMWKYFVRTLVTLFIFGIPFALIKIAIATHTLNISIILESIVAVLTNNSFDHLWYLYSLLGIYLVLPVLKRFVDNTLKEEYLFILFVMYIFCFIIPTFNKLNILQISFNIPLGYPLFYILMGYFIRKHLQINNIVYIYIILWVILLVGINYYDINLAKILSNYASPFVAIYSICIFISFSNFHFDNFKNLWMIDRLCFGVYLVHPIFIHFIYRLLKLVPSSFFDLLTVFIFTTIVSFVLAYILKKIPIITKYV